MADITLSLTGANGDTITFDTENYLLENGVAGFGRPPIVSRIDESSADGGVFRFSRRGIREIDMPVLVVAGDRLTLETKLRRLARILDDSMGTGATIRATYANGESWTLVGHHVNGAQSETGDNAGDTFCRWILTLQCPQPFWVRDTEVTYLVKSSAAGRGLLSPNTMANMKVAASQTLGSISVENPGDVAAPPTYILTGPMDSASITYGDLGFTYNAAISAGSFVTIDTAAGTVIDNTGANKYGSLSSAPKFFQIPAGNSYVSMTAVNTTTATALQLSFKPRKEVVH